MKKLIIIFILLIGWKVSFPQFLIQASGPVDVCYPSSVTLSVVSPQAGYDYTWFIGGYGCPTAGFAAPYNSGTTLQALITGEFYCLAAPTGGGNPQFSNPITVRVLPGMPASLFMPAPGLYTGNNTCVASASFCIPAIYYQNWPGTIIRWYKNNVLISGASSGSYTATSEGYYKYTVTSGCITALSDCTLVTAPPSATITANGATTFCSGSSVTLNANSGIGYSYQWKKDLANISGATLSSYQASASGSYSVLVTSSCGTAASNTITVTVNSLPSATITPAGPTTFCSGSSVVLNAPVTANRAYQWKKGGGNISGATLSSYTATKSGNYKVTVTNTVTGCSKTTPTATIVTVNALPAATITPQGPTTFCAGGSVLLEANTGTGLTYKWKKNGAYISGAVSVNYTATTAGIYRVQVTNSNGCSKISQGVTVTVPCRGKEEKLNLENDFNVTVYPNPSSGDFVFEFNNQTSDKISVRVYDVTGQLILSRITINSRFTICKPQLSAGVYFVEIIQRESKKTLKVIRN